MKKIISGYFFRSIRSAELWIFTALVIIISFFGIGFPTLITEEALGRDYQLTMTVEEAYELSEDFNADIDGDIDTKIKTLITDEIIVLIIPAIMIPLFIVLFMGRTFTGGAIRNLISSGHSKASVYLSSFIFGSLIAVAFNILSLLSMSAAILVYQWKYPIFFPLLCTYALYMCLVDIVLVSVSLAVLFVSKRPVVSLIAVAGVIVLLFTGSAGVTMSMLLIPERYLSAAAVKEYRDEHPESDIDMDWTLDIENFQDVYTFTDHGEPLDGSQFMGPKQKGHIDGTPRKILITGLYSNPACGALMSLFQITSRYRMWKDGFYAFFCLIDILWISVINAVGLIVFRRQEIN